MDHRDMKHPNPVIGTVKTKPVLGPIVPLPPALCVNRWYPDCVVLHAHCQAAEMSPLCIGQLVPFL